MTQRKRALKMMPLEMQVCNDRLAFLRKSFPGFDKQIELVCQTKETGRFTWPDWALCPSDLTSAFLAMLLPQEVRDNHDELNHWFTHSQVVPGYIAWKRDPKEYNIDELAVERIKTQEIPLYIEPGRIRKFLTQPFYIGVGKGLDVPFGRMHGYFIWLDYHMMSKTTFIHIDACIGDEVNLFIIPLEEGTLEAACREFTGESTEEFPTCDHYESVKLIFKTFLWLLHVAQSPAESRKEDMRQVRDTMDKVRREREAKLAKMAVRRKKPVRDAVTAKKREAA